MVLQAMEGLVSMIREGLVRGAGMEDGFEPNDRSGEGRRGGPVGD